MKQKRKYTPKNNDELKQKWEQLPLEKGDIPAMILAALTTILPMAIFVGSIIVAFIWLLFLT